MVLKKLLQFSSFLSNLLRFKEEVENGIIMFWNGLHKFQVLIFGITRTPFWTKASKIHMIDHWRETTSEQIWQVEKGLALIVFDNNFHKKGFCMKTNMKLDFLRMFGNSLLIYLLSKKFMECISYWIKLNRCLELVFGAHFLSILPKKIFVMWYSINWPCFKIRPSLLLKIVNDLRL